MRLLIDTNVLIDYYLRREPFFQEWVRLRAMQMFGDVELWASAKSFTDVFYVVKKAVGSRSIQKAILESLSFIELCSINAEDVKKAAEASWEDFEDCLIDISAQKIKADFILSRDSKGFQEAKTPVKSPHGFLEWYEKETGVIYDEVIF